MAIQQPLPPARPRRASEVAGNATAECAAVCCCIPCAVMDWVALAVYKLPAWLLKKAKSKRRLQKQQKKKKKKNEVETKPKPKPETVVVGPTLEDHLANESQNPAEVNKLEEEMWARFSGTGFWRSSSQLFEPEIEPGKNDR